VNALFICKIGFEIKDRGKDEQWNQYQRTPSKKHSTLVRKTRIFVLPLFLLMLSFAVLSGGFTNQVAARSTNAA